ncbi:MAG: 50S ribosomal protein L35 [Candidatus Omnitrophica bacterium]|nr:50S ribosomal protein L35 [Candidatus Omnitrophota bacterium]
MPKVKTRKALAKRVRITKNGKVVRKKAGTRHLLSGKNRKRKRRLKQRDVVAPQDAKMIKRAMPYD